jgi:hypothetical protein
MRPIAPPTPRRKPRRYAVLPFFRYRPLGIGCERPADRALAGGVGPPPVSAGIAPAIADGPPAASSLPVSRAIDRPLGAFLPYGFMRDRLGPIAGVISLPESRATRLRQ